MVKKLLDEGFAEGRDWNCAETVLRAANEAHDLGLDDQAIHMAGPFGGGMAIESVCGAATGALMVLGRLYVEDRAHQSPRMQKLVPEFMKRFETSLGSLMCAPLKEAHRTPARGCRDVIGEAARILDELVAENQP